MTAKEAAKEIWLKVLRKGIRPPGRTKLARLLEPTYGKVSEATTNFWIMGWQKEFKDAFEDVKKKKKKPAGEIVIYAPDSVEPPPIEEPVPMQEIIDGLVGKYLSQCDLFDNLEAKVREDMEADKLTISNRLAYMKVIQDEKKITLAQMEKVGLLEPNQDLNVIFEEHYAEGVKPN